MTAVVRIVLITSRSSDAALSPPLDAGVRNTPARSRGHETTVALSRPFDTCPQCPDVLARARDDYRRRGVGAASNAIFCGGVPA
jgi:hypothetical protein